MMGAAARAGARVGAGVGAGGRAVLARSDTKRRGRCNRIGPAFVPHEEGSDAQWRGVPWARASRISVRSLTSSEASGSGASSAAFWRRALRAFMGTTMQK